MYQRNLLATGQSSLRVFRVTVINGPRQSGKTTLAKQLVANGSYWSFDNDDARVAATSDPKNFVGHGARPMAIDEIQRGGNDVVLAIKAGVDASGDRGQFVLAGSTRFLSVPRLSESLAGRAEILDLWTLSQGELQGVTERFVDLLFDDVDELARRRYETVSREELFRRVGTGSYPEVLAGERDDASRWHRSYLRTVVERDIVDAAAISQAGEVPALLRVIAANSSGEFVATRVAEDLRLSYDTVRRYTALLELVGLVHRIPAWTASLTTREKRHAKCIVTDTGLAASLLGRRASGLGESANPLSGSLLETFVSMEIMKQLGWANTHATLRHWRDRNGAEVDLVLEADDGRVCAIEVKATTSINASDTRHLRTFATQLGERFGGGVLLHLGDRAVPIGDKLWALPVSALWSD